MEAWRRGALAACILVAATSAHAQSAALRAQALDLAYSLDYTEALARLDQAIAADPSDPAAYRRAAAVAWFSILFQRGAILVDDYLGQAQSNVRRTAPPADLDKYFRERIGRATSLADDRVRANPRDADAHYQAGAAAGFMASYTATVEGRVMAGFGTARRAYSEHERVLELDPQRSDAGLVVGTYRYAVSTLSAPMRLLAHIVGFGGGRERGIRLVEDAAAYERSPEAQTDALFTLIVIYNREKQFDAAQRVIARLQERFPRNRLLWLEAGSTALRAGRAGDARRFIEEGLSKLSGDPRPRAFGEEARWHLYHGSALVALKEAAAAERALRLSLGATAPDWVHGRAHKELGKAAELTGDRTRALDEYRTAIELCRAGNDPPCVDEANTLIRQKKM